jgi:hypothetical protein
VGLGCKGSPLVDHSRTKLRTCRIMFVIVNNLRALPGLDMGRLRVMFGLKLRSCVRSRHLFVIFF